MKIASCYSIFSIFAFACLLSSCGFIQKGEFAQRKYYDFPRTKHTYIQIASTQKQEKVALRLVTGNQEKSRPALPFYVSVNKKEVIPSKMRIYTPEKAIHRGITKTADYNPAEPSVISFKKSAIKKQARKYTEYFYSTDADMRFFIMLIAALFLPPLGVYLKDHRITKWFWITLMLCIGCILGGIFFMGSLEIVFGLLWLVAAVLALMYVFNFLMD